MNARCDGQMIERYVDGELGRARRREIERHLAGCRQCQARARLLRLQGQALGEALLAAADEADFSGFEDRVLSGIRAQKAPGWLERIGMWIGGLFSQYKAVWITSIATAAILLAVLIPLLGKSSRQLPVDNEVIIDSMEYTGQRSMIFTVSKNNTTIIWLYDFDRAEQDTNQGEDL